MAFEIPAQTPCPFCEYLAEREPCAFASRTELVSAFLNRAQFERGAVLLVPNVHVESILELDAGLMAAMYAEAQRLARAFIAAFGAVGMNMFQNNGIRAGQAIPHYHVHLVPRYASSNPEKLFQSDEHAHTPVEQLERIAGELRAVLV